MTFLRNYLLNAQLVVFNHIPHTLLRLPIDNKPGLLLSPAVLKIHWDRHFHFQNYHNFNSCSIKDFLIAINLCICFDFNPRLLVDFSIALIHFTFLGYDLWILSIPNQLTSYSFKNLYYFSKLPNRNYWPHWIFLLDLNLI